MATSANSADRLRQADTLAEQGRAPEAAQIYLTLVGDPQVTGQACLGIGRLLHRSGSHAEAEQMLRRALSDPACEPEALVLLARIDLAQGRAEDAAAHYRRCLRITEASSPWHAAAERELAQASPAAATPPSSWPTMTSASAATPTAAGTSPGTDGRRAVTAAEVDRKYRRSIVGTVTDKSSHQENYLGMMNAVAVHDLTLETPDGAIVTATLSGTVISGPVPKEHEVVEIDLGASKKRRSGEAYLTKRLFNHSRNAPVETRTSAAGTRGKGRYLYWLFGAAVVGFMAYVVGALFGLWAGPSPAPQEAGSTTHTFTVPDLKGIKSTAMEAALTHAGFRPGEYVVEQRRNEAPAGTVFATDPAAGANVSVVRAPGVAPTAVLTISLSTGPQGTDLPPDTTNSKNPGPGSSSGPTRSAPGGGDGSNSGRTDTDKVAVPDVAGLSSAEARKALERAGFAVQVAYDAQSTAPPLTAVRTSPDKGTAQGKGRTVTLYLSLAVMPNVTNGSMSLAEARQALKKAGITGRVLFGCDSSEDAIVTGQSPAGGDRVNPTAPVSLCAPAGEPVPVPPTTGTEGPPPAD